MAPQEKSIISKPLDSMIYVVREARVILDVDLAKLYGVTTKRFNEAFKRNRERFPEDFAFRLSSEEWQNLHIVPGTRNWSQFATGSQKHRSSRSMPWAFTEHGALMAANILRSERATEMSVFVIRAFVKLREQTAANEAILKRLAEIDQTLLVHDRTLRDLYHKIMPLLQPDPIPPKRKIGFRRDDDE
jgi:hypothetical protein